MSLSGARNRPSRRPGWVMAAIAVTFPNMEHVGLCGVEFVASRPNNLKSLGLRSPESTRLP